jgi:uncharacterized protein
MSKGTVCITGATSGIGRAFARELAREGYSLILTGRREAQLRELSEELQRENRGGPVEVIIGDLSEPGSCDTLADRLAGQGDLVMVIHNAGYGHRQSFLEAPVEELRAMGELHMQCSVRLVRTAVPVIAERGTHEGEPDRTPAVILVSSLAAFMPAPGPAMYTATKAFLIFLGQALQPDLASRGIRLQVLCPGFTHTDFHDRLDWSTERRRNRGLVRWMDAEEVVRRSLRRLWRKSLWSNPVYVPGWSNRALLLSTKLLPRRLYLFLISRFRF